MSKLCVRIHFVSTSSKKGVNASRQVKRKAKVPSFHYGRISKTYIDADNKIQREYRVGINKSTMFCCFRY